jgi:hypothetical protein
MATSFDRLLRSAPLASTAIAREAFPARRTAKFARANSEKLEGEFGSKRGQGSGVSKNSAAKGNLSRLLKQDSYQTSRTGRRGQGDGFNDMRQRAAVKVHFFNHAKGNRAAGGGGGGMRAHTRYLARDAAGRDEEADRARGVEREVEINTSEDQTRAHSQYLSRGEQGKGVFYDKEHEGIDGGPIAEAWTKSDKRHFRIILSPEEGERLRDLTAYTREVMERAEAHLGTKLQWIAVDHHDTAHAHTHIILRGRRANGQDLIIPKDFIQHGWRNIARDIATEWLGRRTRSQEREALDREALRHAPTRLDRHIALQLPEDNTIRMSRLKALNADPHITSALKARARELERLGLATEIKRGVLRFEPDWQDRLKALELHLDIRRNLMNERRLQQQMERERMARSLSMGLER